MIDDIARKSGSSLWKEVGEKAVKKAVSTFVGEGIKAVVEIWKERHMKELDLEYKEREKARKEEAADADGADEGDDGDEDDPDATGCQW